MTQHNASSITKSALDTADEWLSILSIIIHAQDINRNCRAEYSTFMNIFCNIWLVPESAPIVTFHVALVSCLTTQKIFYLGGHLTVQGAGPVGSDGVSVLLGHGSSLAQVGQQHVCPPEATVQLLPPLRGRLRPRRVWHPPLPQCTLLFWRTCADVQNMQCLKFSDKLQNAAHSLHVCRRMSLLWAASDEPQTLLGLYFDQGLTIDLTNLHACDRQSWKKRWRPNGCARSVDQHARTGNRDVA